MKLFSPDQAIVLVQLLIAHFLADFVLQSTAWVNDKKQKGLLSWGFYKHLLVVGVLTLIAIGWSNVGIVVLITITHGIIDYWKFKVDNNGTLKYFIIDQLLHILILIISWLLILNGWNQFAEFLCSLKSSFDAQLMIFAYIFVMWPVGYIIKFATKDLITQTNTDNIKRGGMVIGIFERMIILTFVLFGQYEAIGFLITGKSILRFGDGQRKKPNMSWLAQ